MKEMYLISVDDNVFVPMELTKQEYGTLWKVFSTFNDATLDHRHSIVIFRVDDMDKAFVPYYGSIDERKMQRAHVMRWKNGLFTVSAADDDGLKFLLLDSMAVYRGSGYYVLTYDTSTVILNLDDEEVDVVKRFCEAFAAQPAMSWPQCNFYRIDKPIVDKEGDVLYKNERCKINYDTMEDIYSEFT